LELNEKDKNGRYQLLLASQNKNFKFEKILIDYANNHQIILEFNTNDFILTPNFIELLKSNKTMNVRILK